MSFFDKLFRKKTDSPRDIHIFAPVAGHSVPLTEVPDPTFSGGVLGSGAAVIPTDGKVYAPCDASVDLMFATGHAVNLFSDGGAEILIHMGLETMHLDGKCFTVHVQNGDKVKKGDLLVEMDVEGIRAAGMNPITAVVVCNTADFARLRASTGKEVTNTDVLIELSK